MIGVDVITGEQVEETHLDGLLSQHVSKKAIMIRESHEAFDQHSAVDGAWKTLSQKLDILRYYNFHIPSIEKKAIVI